MNIQPAISSLDPVAPRRAIDVTIVMPCLNERISLPYCIANAQEALSRIEQRYGLSGEILVADNGSTVVKLWPRNSEHGWFASIAPATALR